MRYINDQCVEDLAFTPVHSLQISGRPAYSFRFWVLWCVRLWNNFPVLFRIEREACHVHIQRLGAVQRL